MSLGVSPGAAVSGYGDDGESAFDELVDDLKDSLNISVLSGLICNGVVDVDADDDGGSDTNAVSVDS